MAKINQKKTNQVTFEQLEELIKSYRKERGLRRKYNDSYQQDMQKFNGLYERINTRKSKYLNISDQLEIANILSTNKTKKGRLSHKLLEKFENENFDSGLLRILGGVSNKKVSDEVLGHLITNFNSNAYLGIQNPDEVISNLLNMLAVTDFDSNFVGLLANLVQASAPDSVLYLVLGHYSDISGKEDTFQSVYGALSGSHSSDNELADMLFQIFNLGRNATVKAKKQFQQKLQARQDHRENSEIKKVGAVLDSTNDETLSEGQESRPDSPHETALLSESFEIEDDIREVPSAKSGGLGERANQAPQKIADNKNLLWQEIHKGVDLKRPAPKEEKVSTAHDDIGTVLSRALSERFRGTSDDVQENVETWSSDDEFSDLPTAGNS